MANNTKLTATATLEMRMNRCRAALAASYNVNELFGAAMAYLLPLSTSVARDAQHPAQQELAERLLWSLREFLQRTAVSLEDADRLQAVGREIAGSEMQDMGMLVLIFCERISESLVRVQSGNHSHFGLMDLHCLNCGTSGVYPCWSIVNTTERPDLRESARSGNLTRLANCHNCDRFHEGCVPFIYCDPMRGEYLIYLPSDDSAFFEEMRQGCLRYLDELPGEFKGGASYVTYYEGFPGPWSGPYPECMPLFWVRSEEEFLRIVNEELYEANAFRRADGGMQVNAANGLLREGDYSGAARRYGVIFLDDQLQCSVLKPLSDCLTASGKTDLASKIATHASALRSRLVQEGLIQCIRLDRSSPSNPNSYARPFNPMEMEIWENGLPADWGFVELVELVKKIVDLH